jgi:glycosyltransferase involved in cell wall biosynthesis
MNILIDAHIFDDFFHGARSFIKGLYNAILEKEKVSPTGNRYYFAATNIENLRDNFPPSECVEYIRLKSNGSFGRLFYEYPRIIKKYKIDLAHFQYIVPFVKSCRYIVTIHDLIFLEMPEYYNSRYRFLRKYLFAKAYKKADIISTVSEYSKRQVHSLFGKDKQVHILPNACSNELLRFRPGMKEDEWLAEKELRPYILYVSRFEPRKNHHALLQAYVSSGLHKTFDLVLIGHKTIPVPAFDSVYLTLTAEIKRSIRIISDPVTDEQLYHYLKFAAVFVYPSLAEGFGIPPLEAAASGTPVVCSDKTAMADFTFFREGHIDPSVGNISDALQKKLFGEKHAIENECRRINEYVRLTYTWENTADAFFAAIATLKKKP